MSKTAPTQRRRRYRTCPKLCPLHANSVTERIRTPTIPLPNESETPTSPRRYRYRTCPKLHPLSADTVTERVRNSDHPMPIPNESETPTSPRRYRYRTCAKLHPLSADTVTERVRNSVHSTPTALLNEFEPRRPRYRTSPRLRPLHADTVIERARTLPNRTDPFIEHVRNFVFCTPTSLPNESKTPPTPRRHRYKMSLQLCRPATHHPPTAADAVTNAQTPLPTPSPTQDQRGRQRRHRGRHLCRHQRHTVTCPSHYQIAGKHRDRRRCQHSRRRHRPLRAIYRRRYQRYRQQSCRPTRRDPSALNGPASDYSPRSPNFPLGSRQQVSRRSCASADYSARIPNLPRRSCRSRGLAPRRRHRNHR